MFVFVFVFVFVFACVCICAYKFFCNCYVAYLLVSLDEEELSLLSLDEICPDMPPGNLYELATGADRDRTRDRARGGFAGLGVIGKYCKCAKEYVRPY